jgi:hypothetical protein
MNATNQVVAVETVKALGKVRIQWADGKYAYLTLEEVGQALRTFAAQPKAEEREVWTCCECGVESRSCTCLTAVKS